MVFRFNFIVLSHFLEFDFNTPLRTSTIMKFSTNQKILHPHGTVPTENVPDMLVTFAHNRQLRVEQ